MNNNEAILRELLRATLSAVPFSHSNEPLKRRIVDVLASIEQAPDAGQVPVAWLITVLHKGRGAATTVASLEPYAQMFGAERKLISQEPLFAAPVAPTAIKESVDSNARYGANGWKLDFHPSPERPTEPGEYILFNQCDGYHVAEAWFFDGVFSDFWVFAASQPVSRDFYCAWARLPDTLKDLYPIFAKSAAPIHSEGEKG